MILLIRIIIMIFSNESITAPILSLLELDFVILGIDKNKFCFEITIPLLIPTNSPDYYIPTSNFSGLNVDVLN